MANFENDFGVDASLCPRHQIKFGLVGPIEADTNGQPVSCGQCRGFHSTMAHVTNQLRDAGADDCVLKVVKDCHTKMIRVSAACTKYCGCILHGAQLSRPLAAA